MENASTTVPARILVRSSRSRTARAHPRGGLVSRAVDSASIDDRPRANHSSRISAMRRPVSTIVAAAGLGPPVPLPLVAEAEKHGEASGIVSLNGRPYQLVVVPVLGPQPIAWVSMGFQLDGAVLNEVRRLTALDVSLGDSAAGANPFVISTLPTDRIGSSEYRSLSHPLKTADGSRIDTLLQRSVEEATRSYRDLELQIAALSTLALVVALIAESLFARGVSRPLERLAEGAQRIERGVTQKIDVKQRDEIGRGTAFDRMHRNRRREDRIRYRPRRADRLGRVLFLERLSQAVREPKQATVGMLNLDVQGDQRHPRAPVRRRPARGDRAPAAGRASPTRARLGGDGSP
jgi:HAMP domain-containing protein